MTTKQSIIDAIIDNYDVTEVTVTSGNNGYPRNLRTALFVNDWDDAQAIADAYPQVTISSIRKRDGWSLWECRRAMWQAYDMLAEYEQYGRVIQTKNDVINHLGLDDTNFLREMSTEDLADRLECASKLLRDVDGLCDDEFIGNEDTDDCDNYHSYSTYDKYQMSYREDVWQYHIAITFDGISDEEDEE